MKPVALLTILLTLASGTLVNAQFKHIGVKVGGTSASIIYHYQGAEDLPIVRRTGVAVAAFAEWFENSPVTLLTQVEYVQKGAGMEITYMNATDQYHRDITYERRTEYSRLDYLSIPLLGKATLPLGTFSPYVLAGPRIDFLLGYANDMNGFHQLYDSYQKTLLGLTLGAGTHIETLLPVPVLIEARYNLDITNSYEKGILTTHNNSFDLWLGVAF